ncbi:MAG: DUF3662 and FHA domain-containing protein [Nitriliruptoraceae bacterium]
MGVLQEFERRLEGAVEGFFARAFRSGIQPIELAKALQRYIADHQHVTADGIVVPNVFRLYLSPKDQDRLSSFGSSLPRELGEVVVRTAAERGWLLRGPVKVRIDVDDAVRVGRYRLQGRVEVVDPALVGASDGSTAHGSGGFDRTQIIGDVPVNRYRLVVTSGPSAGAEYAVTGSRITVGRSSSCDVPLDDTTVSREHAAIVAGGDGWWVADLGSTNGTRCNGSATREAELRPGDVIEFGGIAVEFVEA